MHRLEAHLCIHLQLDCEKEIEIVRQGTLRDGAVCVAESLHFLVKVGQTQMKNVVVHRINELKTRQRQIVVSATLFVLFFVVVVVALDNTKKKNTGGGSLNAPCWQPQFAHCCLNPWFAQTPTRGPHTY